MPQPLNTDGILAWISAWIHQKLGTKQDSLTFDDAPTSGSNNPVKSGGVYTATNSLNSAVSGINAKIPSAASSSNQLADKAYLASQISGFITKSVNDLTNYYLKSETYTKEEVLALIAAINQFHYEVYPSTSAVTSPANNVLYLIGPTGQGSDKYEEYVYPDSTTGWVKIGDTSIDLSDYYTKTQADTLLAEKEAVANKVTSIDGDSTDTQYPSAKVVYDAFTSDNAEIQALAKLLVQQQYEIDGLKKMVEENLGDIRATTINTDNMPMVSGKPLIIVENGAPTEVPYFVGQIHVNRSTNPSTIKVCYQVTGSISDWK